MRRLATSPLLALSLLLLCYAGTPSHGQDKSKITAKEPLKTNSESLKDNKEFTELKGKVDLLSKVLETREKEIDSLKAQAKEQEKTSSEKLTSLEQATKTAINEAAALKKELSDVKKTAEEMKKSAEEKKPDPKEKDDAKKELDDLKAGIEEAKKAAGDLAAPATQKGDTAWLLTATAFVFIMMPGLALFYGGMVRKKNILATMMHTYASLAVVGLYWFVFGYGLAFGPSKFTMDLFGVTDGGIIGWDWKLFCLWGVKADDLLPGYNIHVYTHVLFQGMFAIITPALIAGAFAERIRFWPWCIFLLLWLTLVYCPLAHMVWAFDWFAEVPMGDPNDEGVLPAIGATAIGLLGKLGAWDFAGGTVVHIAAGVAGLAGIVVLRKRTGYPEHPVHPNSMVLTLLGAGLLWFGWFGFNGGSGLNSTSLSASAFAATQAAAASAGLSWIVVEWLLKGKPTALGMASGIVAGLVAVTPASGYVYVWGGAAIGLLAGVVCYLAVWFKSKLGYDDSLDAFGVHGVGGFLGAILTGVFCYGAIQGNNAAMDGYFAVSSMTARKETVVKDIETAKTDRDKLEKDASTAKSKFEADKDNTDLKKESAVADFKLAAAKSTLDGLEKEKKLVEETLEKYKKDERTPMKQVIIQLKAAGFSVVYAFVLTLVITIVVQILTLGNFTTTVKDETEGLDRTEHGEVGFDYGLALESIGATSIEPRPAKVPPGGRRFDVVVEGIENGSMMLVWNELCQPVEAGKPMDPDFKAVYPFVTTVQGNRFRFRGGDATTLSTHIQKLFARKLGKRDLRVRVEE